MNNHPKQIHVNLNQLKNFQCPKCKGEEFTTVYYLKEVSAILSKTGKEELLPVEFFKCVKCGFVTPIVKTGR